MSPLVRFGIVLAVVLVLAAVIVNAQNPPTPSSPCPAAPVPCAVPPVPPGAPAPGEGTVPGPASSTGPDGTDGTPELVVGTAWSSAAFGFSFHYDPQAWVVEQDQPDLLELFPPSDSNGQEREDWLIVEGVAASTATPEQLIQERVANLRKSVPDITPDPSSYYQINGAEIGNIAGTGQVYVGTLDDTDGTPIAPVRYSIVAASNGQVTVALTVRTLDPDDIADHGPPVVTWHLYSRQLADALLEDFRWPAAH